MLYRRTILQKFILMLKFSIDPPGCSCGFMSVERMRLLLELDRMSELMEIEGQQQITPEMRFTCDGIITKLILGVEVQDDESKIFPEIQVWRKSNNTTYRRINGTGISILTANRGSNRRMFVYDTSIPIKSEDILGVFGPQSHDSRFVVLSEETDSPTNYIMSTGNSRNTPYNSLNIQSSLAPPLLQNHRPLVSVEIGIIKILIQFSMH